MSRSVSNELTTQNGRSFGRYLQAAGMVAGPIMAGVCFFLLPLTYVDASGNTTEFSVAGRATLAAMVWMATWWLTEATHISVTALLPLALFPLLGIADMKEAAAPYAHPLIFLFLGGFILALSMGRWGLDRRISLLTLRMVGTRPTRMVAGFMLATATLSAFVSNTATTAMMLPIALSVVGLVAANQERIDAKCISNFSTCLMLAIAYSASVGGMVTIVGTPPNVFLVSFLRNTISEPYRIDVSFARWLLIGIPLACLFLPTIWLLLNKVIYPVKFKTIPGGDRLIVTELQKLGPMNRGEWVTLILFLLTAGMWITLPLLKQIHLPIGDGGIDPLAKLTDPGVVMLTAVLLFVIPTGEKERRFTMDWETAVKLPWGVLVLFGGGLSLAAAVDRNGVAPFIGSFSSYVAGVPAIVLLLAITTVIIFLTELTSNLATTAAVIPILAGLAPGLGMHPYDLVVPATLAASCAFMLPVATPPNAIVFGSGKITMGQMARAGFWLNLVSILFVTAISSMLVDVVFGR
ncbi:MAG: DASS family sodium-coupled anion symporter [Planctomycetaceae bacterium]|nr:DASS family sodium-coupled anion symporter [Planctomycetaceae bacterium]